MFSFKHLTLLALLVAAVTSHAWAQSVHWESADSGDPSELQLIFENCAPDGDPQMPRIDGTILTLAGTASQTTITNGSLSRSTILTYRARAQKSGPIQIPPFIAQTNKGAIRVPAFNGGATRTASDANISSKLDPGSTTVWAGEVFPLTYVLDVARRTFNQLGTAIDWNPSPFVIEDWSKFEPAEAIVGGEARLRISSNTRGYAKTPGTFTLNAANQLVNIQSGSIGFGLFQTPRIEQLAVASNRPVITVRPLPAATIAGFSGAVGQFKLTSKVVPTNAAVGEPVTWTLELSGTGNWPDVPGLPSREVSKDFKVVQPQAKKTPAEGKLFDTVLSEDVVLVPTKAGSYTLGPVEFVYFDPATGTYRTASTPKTTITIAPPVASLASTPAPAASGSPAKETVGSPRPAPPELKPPVTPEGIPKDPLGGSSHTAVPLPFRTLFSLVLIPFVLLPFWWGWLALRRAKKTDPIRPRREAYARLVRHIAEIRQVTGASRSRLLLAWQHDSTILWALSHAAPLSRSLPDPAWAALWTEADRTLYSSAGELPADWPDRARAALLAKRIPSFSPLRLFLPQNLLPFVATLALAMLWIPRGMAEEAAAAKSSRSPEAAYRSGDFATAEKIWKAVIAENPTDSIARYNLSLALAQQDRWSESVAQATASFVQNPSEPRTRWQLALAGEKAGFVPAPVVRFLPSGPLQSLAELASPARWQIYLIAASFVFVLALGILLHGCYGSSSRIKTLTALCLLGVGTVAALSAIASLQTYGVGADRRAVVTWRAGLLRSIPTEADTTQKTTPLAAGSAAIAEKTFLNDSWVHLTFDGGQSGWVRKDELVALWR